MRYAWRINQTDEGAGTSTIATQQEQYVAFYVCGATTCSDMLEKTRPLWRLAYTT